MMIIIKMCLPLMQKAMKCCHIEYNAASWIWYWSSWGVGT
jgi:hypothetical protein